MIDKTAIIEDGVFIGENCSIGPFSIIRTGSHISPNSSIGSFCDVGVHGPNSQKAELKILENAIIRSHSVIYSGSEIGRNLKTGHHVTIRENSKIGNDVQIGTLSDIQGDCSIGSFTRLHSNVHIGKHSVVGEYVWIYPYVVLTNDPHPPSETVKGVTVEDFAVIATMSVILPGIRVNMGSLVGAHSLVTKDVPFETLVAGVPARAIKNVKEIQHEDLNEPAYPWPTHFSRGYADELLKEYDRRRREVL